MNAFHISTYSKDFVRCPKGYGSFDDLLYEIKIKILPTNKDLTNPLFKIIIADFFFYNFLTLTE